MIFGWRYLANPNKITLEAFKLSIVFFVAMGISDGLQTAVELGYCASPLDCAAKLAYAIWCALCAAASWCWATGAAWGGALLNWIKFW